MGISEKVSQFEKKLYRLERKITEKINKLKQKKEKLERQLEAIFNKHLKTITAIEVLEKKLVEF